MTGDRMSVRRVPRDEWPALAPRLARLSREITYPLGERRFRIDHGADYFEFFRHLGDVEYLVAESRGRLLGTLAAVRRQLDDGPAWYLCDLKGAQGARAPVMRSLLGAVRELPGAERVYGVSMNPPGDAANGVFRLARRFAPDVELGSLAMLYSLNAHEMRFASGLLTDAFGRLSYLSLAGVKDLVVDGAEMPLPIRHVQHGRFARDGAPEPVDGAQHMFWLQSTAPSFRELSMPLGLRGHVPTASAMVLHVGMPGTDWDVVLTSDV